jgi:uncharacterized protein (DUF362 family)
MTSPSARPPWGKISRRDLLIGTLAGTGIGTAGAAFLGYLQHREDPTETFIARASSYEADLGSIIDAGLEELGVGPAQVRGRRILLKPNLVETLPGTAHICTRPEVVVAAAEAFLRRGAARVIVGEGPGHCRDMARVLEEAGMAQALAAHKLAFVDFNDDDLVVKPNAGRWSRLRTLTLPATLEQVDWVVSMPKMKTHHWAGVTLSMKNLFGLMSGLVYGWPKNVFHWAGIPNSILDINATVRPHFAIVDGVIGMEGDGPIMGTPKPAGVIVMGRNPLAVDATAARIMGIDPWKVAYLKAARGRYGTISAQKIGQRGETIAAVRTDFQLLDYVPAHQGLRLVSDAGPGSPAGS